MNWKIILILFFTSQAGYCQDSIGFYVNYGAEIYSMNFDELYTGLYYEDTVESDFFTTRLASCSFVRNKGRVIREWEVMPVSFSKKNYSNYFVTNTDTIGLDGKTVLKYSTYIRYFKGYSLNQPDKKAVFYIGFSAGVRYDWHSVKPYYSNAFPVRYQTFKADLSMNPYLKLKIRNIFFLTAGIPFQIIGLKALYSKDDDPYLPGDMQRTKSNEFEIFPKYYMFKIGMGVEFK